MSLTKALKNDSGVSGDHWEVTKITNHLLLGKIEVELSLFLSASEKTKGSNPLRENRIFWMSNSDTATSTIEDNIKADAEDTFFSDAVKA